MPGYELIGKEESKEIKDLFNKSKTLSRMGFDKVRKKIYKVKQFENNFSKFIKSPYCLAVTSGTAALRIALATLGIKKGDEVLTSAFTFVATVEAIVESGAQPIIVDINDTLNISPKDLKKKITKKTKALIVVHMLGVPVELKEIKKICLKRKIKIIEDTAWGCGAKYNGKYLGTHGDIGAFSYDFAKTITTGEGGMLTFKDKKLFLKAAAWHDHGHENNPKVPRWEDTRTSRMNEMQGAVGIAQLRKIKFILKMQRTNHDLIWNSIKNIPNVTLRKYPKTSLISADALIFLVKNKKIALKCRSELLKRGISTKILPEAYTWHFAGEWKHIKELNFKYKNLKNKFNLSKKYLDRAVSLPISIKMKKNLPNIIKNSIIEAQRGK